jgi:hypothetical protein
MENRYCVRCSVVKTDNFSKGERICVTCSNNEYYNDLKNGDRVELKIDLREYSQGTLEEIKYVLAKNKLNI